MNKRFLFGFCSPADLLTTLFNFKSIVWTAISTGLITLGEVAGFIYSPASVVYLLFFIMCVDWATGSAKAMKLKKFNSFTFQRMLLNIFLTMLLIGISTQLAVALPVFTWLKINEVLISGFMITYLYSIIENLHAIDNRIVSDKLFEYIKGILNLDTYFKKFFTPKELEITNDKESDTVDDAHICTDELPVEQSGKPANAEG